MVLSINYRTRKVHFYYRESHFWVDFACIQYRYIKREYKTYT